MDLVSELGAGGRRRQNLERDLSSSLNTQIHRLGLCSMDPISVKLPLKTLASLKRHVPVTVADTPVALMQPWDVLWDIERLGVTEFSLGNVTASRLIEFWSELESSGWLESNHPICSLPINERARALPIFWHYDEVKVSRGSGGDTEVLVVSWSSGLARSPGDVCLAKFPFMQVETYRICGDQTYAAIIEQDSIPAFAGMVSACLMHRNSQDSAPSVSTPHHL